MRRDPAGWQRAIEQAEPLIDFLIEAQTAGLALDTPQGKMEARAGCCRSSREVRDRTLAGEYADRLAAKLKLDAREVQMQLQRTRTRLDREVRAKAPRPVERVGEPGAAADEPGQLAHQTARQDSTKEGDGVGAKSHPSAHEAARARYSSASAAPLPASAGVMGAAMGAAMGGLLVELAQEEYCVGLLIEHPSTWVEMRAILEETDFSGTETRALFAAVAGALRAAEDLSVVGPNELLSGLDPVLQETAEHAQARASATSKTNETTAQSSDEDEEAGGTSDEEEGLALMKRASQAAYRLKRMRLKAEQAELDYLIRDAEGSADREGLRALLQRQQHLLAQRHTIDEATSLQA